MVYRGRAATINWNEVAKVANDHLGIPEAVGEALSAYLCNPKLWKITPPLPVDDSVVTGDQNVNNDSADSQNQDILKPRAENNDSQDDQNLTSWSQN